MVTLKYAVIHFYTHNNVTDLKCHVVYDNLPTRKLADAARSLCLKLAPKAEPQNYQVIQYK